MRRRSTWRASLNSWTRGRHHAGSGGPTRSTSGSTRLSGNMNSTSMLRNWAPASSSPRTELRTRRTRTRSGSRLNRVWNASAAAICGARSRRSLRTHETSTCSVRTPARDSGVHSSVGRSTRRRARVRSRGRSAAGDFTPLLRVGARRRRRRRSRARAGWRRCRRRARGSRRACAAACGGDGRAARPG